MPIKLTQEQAISRCKEVHGDLYDYSKAIYKGAMEKIEIICRIHGSFWQKFVDHVFVECGCKKCNINYIDNEIFIRKSKEVHGDKYDYSKTKYKNGRSKVIITCKIHGDFEQNASSHLRGIGCRKCGGTNPLTQSEFIQKAITVHGDRYDYSKTEYINYASKIIIICKDHGEFKQIARDHLWGKGCYKCHVSKREILIAKFFTDNNISFIPQKTFPDCKITRLMPFDFYIPSKNILIEYDGELHYKPFRVSKRGEEKLKKVQKNDAFKSNFCKDNMIPLIRLPYWLSDEEIRDVLRNLILTV